MNTLTRNDAGGRYVLSGASGMLGSALRAALVNRGDEVIQLVRRASAKEGEVPWDPGAASPVSCPEMLEGATAAIHLSGANVAARRWTPEFLREVTASRVDSTRALSAMLAGMPKRPQSLLVASAVGIYGSRGDEVLDESSRAGEGFLAGLCQKWEAAARPAVESGMRVVHLRIGVVLDRRDGALAKMLPLFRMGLGGRMGSGKQWMSWISLADLVRAVLFALDTPSITGPVNLTSPEPVRNAEFTRALGRALRRPAVMAAPAFALRIAMGKMADEALLSSTRAVPAKLLGAGFRFAQPGIEAGVREALHE
jgi:uncharacterized protein (TIGR01777 family)